MLTPALQEGGICISEPYDMLTCNNEGFRSTEKLLVIPFICPGFSDFKVKLWVGPSQPNCYLLCV